MKTVDYLLHKYFERLHELSKIHQPGSTVIGKCMEDGGAGEASFGSRPPSGVVFTDVRLLLDHAKVDAAMSTLRRGNESYSVTINDLVVPMYDVIKLGYERLECGSRRSQDVQAKTLCVSIATNWRKMNESKKALKKLMRLD
jgi:hypothetical protein